jgi:hypothetical protein
MNQKLHEILGLDLRTLALFRVLLGILLLGELAARLPDIRAFYTDEGIAPIDTIPRDVSLSIHLLNGSLAYQLFLFGVAAVFAVMVAIGYQTRLAVLMSWFLLISLQGRNVAIQHNGDVVFRNFLFFAIFLPLGALWSVDSRFRSRPPGVGPQFLNGGTIAYILQMCFVYWFAVLWKSAPEWRSDFTAVYYALHVEALASPVAVFVRQFTWLLPLLTVSTMIIEAIGPLLILFPFGTQWTRLLAVFLFIGLHAGFGLCLVLGNFAPVCWVAWIALLPPLFWTGMARWASTATRRAHILRTAVPAAEVPPRLEAVRNFLLLGNVKLEPGSTAPEGTPAWWVHDEQTKTDLTGAAALGRLLWLSPVFWPLVWLFPRSILAWVATWMTRPAVPTPDEPTFQTRFLQPYQGTALNAIALFCLVYIALWNVRTVAAQEMRQAFPLQISGLGVTLSFDQSHGVFAPAPGKRHGWNVLAARLGDGTEIDLLTEKPPDFENRPDNMYRLFINSRWRRLMQNFTNPTYAGILPYYADWQRREWNRLNPDRPLVALEIWMIPLETRPRPEGFKQYPKTLLYRFITRTEDRETKP